MHQMDVKTAYLNAPIDCELYVEQPEGYERKDPSGEKRACKRNKSEIKYKKVVVTGTTSYMSILQRTVLYNL